DLLEALRHHEPAAAECLVGAYGERAYRLAARITRNEQDAEEVVQDAFYAVIRQIDTFIQTELRMVLEAAIDELPPAYRIVLVLCDVEGRSIREIAELLDLSVPAVKIRIHRARLFVRKELGGVMTARDRD